METTRRAIAEHADRIGFGRVVRVHRQRRDSDSAVVFLGVVALVAGAVIVEFVEHDSAMWQLVVLGYVVLAWLTAAWVWWGPVADPMGRLRLVVAEQGLILWHATPSAVRWEDLRVEPLTATSDWLTWQDAKGRRRTLAPPTVTGRRDLFQAARRGRPGAPWSARRLAGIAPFWVVTVVALGIGGVPVALDVVDGDRPERFGDLAKVCDGAPVGRAAAYDGPGPHPVAVFVEGSFDHLAGSDTTPDAVPLVACGQRVGGTFIRTCEYEGGHTVDLHQIRYRAEVREARTARVVDAFTVEGDPGMTCEEYIWVHRGERPTKRADVNEPDEDAYAEKLVDLISGG
jgi:hypothetical protein